MPSQASWKSSTVGSLGEHIERTRTAVNGRLNSAAWRRQAAAIIICMGLGIFVARTLAGAWPGQFATFFPDSASFKNAARDTPFSPEFYADERPVGYPFLLFMLGRSTVLTVVVQTILYGTAFTALAAALWRWLHSDVTRAFGAVLAVATGVQSRFSLWNSHILSESLGITLGVVSVIAWWRFGCQRNAAALRWAGIASVAWLLTRDSNVPPFALVSIPALAATWLLGTRLDPALRQAMKRWAIGFVMLCLLITVTQSASGRNRFPTMNNVGQRVLVDEKITAWFVDQGMPISDAIRERTGKSSFDDEWKTLTSPELANFRAWADDIGQRTMLLAYVRFFPTWYEQFTDSLPTLLATDHSAYDAFGVTKRLPDTIPWQLGGPRSSTALQCWLAIAFVGLLCAARRRPWQASVLALLLSSALIDMYMAYIGDSVEVQRHSVGPLSRLGVILLISVAIGTDAILDALRHRRSTAVEVAAPAELDTPSEVLDVVG